VARRLTQRQYIAVIAVTSVVVLALGVLLKPKQLPAPTISGEETLRLQTLTQRRNLENLAVYFSEVAGGIQPGLVWLNEIALTGLVWNQEGLIVTAGPNHLTPEEVTALTTRGNITVKSQLLSVNFRAASLEAPRGSRLQPVHKSNFQGLTPGIWIIQVARQAGGNYLFTPGVYGGIAPTRCGSTEYQAIQSNLPLTDSALGGGLFDVDGNLLGVLLRCGDHLAAVVPADVDRELARAASLEGQLLQSYGLQMTGLDDVSRRYFQSQEGVLVTAVTDGQLADVAGLTPGDVITTLDKTPVLAPDDLRPLTMSKDGNGFQLEVRRKRRTVRIDLQTGASQAPGQRQSAEFRDVALTDPSQGYLVETVLRGSRADRASIQAGDRLLLVDGKPPRSVAAVRKAFSEDNRDPIFLLLHRGSRKIGTFLN
jgi:S1-C subfamily serine protease